MPLSALQDRYAQIAPLGAGGFGEVYRAEQISTGQLVAIKRLKVDLSASESDVGRFARELLDFGIAAICEGQRDAAYDVLTRDGEAPGTLCYSAPEQIRGQGMHPQVDLFAWGLVFVEALTGERVVSGRLQSDVLRMLLGPAPIELPEYLRDQPIACHGSPDH